YAAVFRAAITHFVPRLAAVSGLEDAAHLIAGPLVTRRRDKHDVRIHRIHEHAADRAAVGESHLRPGLAGVSRFVNPGTGKARAEQVVLARAHPDDVVIRRRDGDVADAGSRFVLENRAPRLAALGGLP